MSSTKQHWESINGKGEVISNTPEGLWEAACSYFKFCDENPIKVSSSVKVGKRSGDEVLENKARPYNIKGLCLHCGILEDYFKMVADTPDKSNSYYQVCAKILYVIYLQNVEYATVGVFNAVFTSRMLGLDNADQDVRRGATITIVGDPTKKLASSEQEVEDAMQNENPDLESEIV